MRHSLTEERPNRMCTSGELMKRAWQLGTVIPAFNIPCLPMMEPVVRALRDTGCFGFITVARLEWEKFEAGSLQAVCKEYHRVKDERFTRLHLDHVPVIDEDGLTVDYRAIIASAIESGYQSVMVDGSRLPLEENIAVTAVVVKQAYAVGIPVEAELGAVLGHESGPLPPYEELFRSRKGFTDPSEARRFVEETGVDWLSVSFGNIHGAISGMAKSQQKVTARLDVEHLRRLREAAGVPLVLHGGSGINPQDVLQAIRNGIAKINIGTAIRQPFERAREQSLRAAQQVVYEVAVRLIREDLLTAGTAALLTRTG